MKITNLLLLASIVLTSNFAAFGQDKDTKIGFRAGWQFSNFYDNGSTYGDIYNSVYIGIFGEKKIIPLLRFSSGIEYFQTGTVDKDLSDTKYVRHTISVPVYLKLKLGPVFALGGVAANLKVADKFTLLNENVDLTDDTKTKVFNAPIIIGVGVKILIVNIEARYHWGTINQSKDATSNFSPQYFQLGAAISF